MRIMITGGAGCLGSNLVEHFFAAGHEICILDNFSTGKRGVILPQPGLQVIEGSICDKELVENVFQSFKPTHVIHSAASYKDPDDWAEDVSTNVLGTINVAGAAKKLPIERFVNFQTALCYGKPKTLPIPVSHETSPFTSYGISKLAGESYLMQVLEMPIISLRIANVCAPRLAIGPIPTFFKRLKAGQNCFCSDTIRDFLDINDFLELIDIVLKETSPTGVFNVSTGEGHSILDVFRVIAEHLGVDSVEPQLRPVGADDVPEVVLDPRETERAFKWRAKVSFKNTILKQLEWYDRHGVNDVFSHLSAPSPQTLHAR